VPKWTGTGCADPTRRPDATYVAAARLAVLRSAIAVLLTGCLVRRTPAGNRDANRNADAKKVELVIGKNSVKGGQGQCWCLR
jgi:hypothetical protein